ncbi:unnamed protein product [Calicophoron daubneyi]|uniref:RNA helicase n=1 Tax=Calicophoron daubneyi TaxID=300641 RepID=A0AAV2TU44_CALDB
MYCNPECGESSSTEDLFGVLKQGEEKGAVGQDSVNCQDSASLLEQRERLPIFSRKKELLKAVEENRILIVVGETGSGKTTQLPQYLAETAYINFGTIGCTQPRRVAAKLVAERVAREYGCALGQDVGYTIRFEDCTSRQTKIKYMTDGTLLQEILCSPTLPQYSVIILDEAHERSLIMDVLFGLLKSLVQRRTDMRLIVTSATLNTEVFCKYFLDAPEFTIPGRMYPVSVRYELVPPRDYCKAAVEKVKQIHMEKPPGDILVFLTGQDEIDECCKQIEKFRCLQGTDTIEPLPAYAEMDVEELYRVFRPLRPGTRKVVFATNIAESSVTIEHIRYVIDSGFVKEKVYNGHTGIESLTSIRISKDQAEQRAGRVGRTGVGVCYRLYTEHLYRKTMPQSGTPEILRSNLANVILKLKVMGIDDVATFDLMNRPNEQFVKAAVKRLVELGALDEQGQITELGRTMAYMPLEPELSKMLIKSAELQCSEEILTIVSVLSARNIFLRPKKKQALADERHAKFHKPEGDLLTYLAIYNDGKRNKFSKEWCKYNFLRIQSMWEAGNIRKQLLDVMHRHELRVVSCGHETARIQKAILAGLSHNLAQKSGPCDNEYELDGKWVYIDRLSALYDRTPNPTWVVAQELVMSRSGVFMRHVTEVHHEWLNEPAPNPGFADQLSSDVEGLKI